MLSKPVYRHSDYMLTMQSIADGACRRLDRLTDRPPCLLAKPVSGPHWDPESLGLRSER